MDKKPSPNVAPRNPIFTVHTGETRARWDTQRGGDLALAIQTLELEYKMRRLSEDGIVVLGDQTEKHLNRKGKHIVT